MNPLPKPSPELFDLQVNGFAGIDFGGEFSLADLRRACEALRHHKMRRILATLITETIETMAGSLERLERFRRADPYIRDTIVGYHLEGPYLSSVAGFRGAHPADLMKDPNLPEFHRLQEAAGGAIRLVTLAPERPGSAEFIAGIVRLGVRVSLGHTDASEEQIDEAIRAGATLCTHLGNGCPAILHRHDNIIQRLLARDELVASLIPDGIHLPARTLKNLFRAKPPGRVILTTDAMAAAGAPPGRYRLGRIAVDVGSDGVVREPGASNFAGSSLTLEVGVANAVRWLGIGEAAAWAMASAIPAAALGLPLRSGDA